MSILLGRDADIGRRIYLPFESFRTHYHFIGGTGKGKTTTIEAILHQLFRSPERAAHFILDRMGSFTFSLLQWFASPYCPPHVRRRLVYIDAAREDLVLPFNPLRYTTPAHGYFKTGRACECILRAWASQNMEEMPRLARWTHNAMWAAAQLHLTVADCAHLLMPGSPYHQAILNRLPPALMAEWSEIQNARSGEASRILESSRNRIKPFIDSSILRGMFGSFENRMDTLHWMREGKIVLVNLAPQERIPPQVADAIGGMLLNEVLATARSLPIGIQYPTYLWLDEAQRYVNPDLETAIPEVRQRGVRLCLSHQSFSQLERGATDLSSLIWQCQSRLIFGVQGEDADLLAHEVASIKYDPKKVKDEVYTRRQLLKDHKLIHLTSWSESETEAENWSKTYGSNWSSSEGSSTAQGSKQDDSTSRSYTGRIGEINPPHTIGRGKSSGSNRSRSETKSKGEGGSSSDGEGGSSSHSKSHSVAESLLPVHEEFLELSRRTYYTFEEQRAEWAKQIRLLQTGQALVRLVNDPNIYRVDVERHAPGYLALDPRKLASRYPQGLESIERLIEENAASDLFVSPAIIERETEERLQRILNPPIIISTTADTTIIENPLA